MTLLEKLLVVKFDRRRMLGIAIGTVDATMFGPLGMAGAAELPVHKLAAYSQSAGFGDRVPDPKGRLALAEGFSYVEISPAGSKLSNGDLVPAWRYGGIRRC